MQVRYCMLFLFHQLYERVAPHLAIDSGGKSCNL